MEALESSHVPFDEWRCVGIEGTRDVREADELRVIRRKAIENLVHFSGVPFASRIFANVEFAADRSNNDVEPEVFDTEAKFEGGILEGRNASCAFCMIEPRERLPEVPSRVKDPFAIDNLVRSAVCMWRNVHQRLTTIRRRPVSP